MLSFRILSGTARGISVLTSNQLAQSSGYKPVSIGVTKTKNDDTLINNCHISTGGIRSLMTSSLHSQVARIGRINKINDMLSEAGVNLPDRPKKPLTPWIMFVRDRKDQVLARHGSKMTAPEISVELAKEWQHTDKSRYEQEYKRLHDEYERQLQNYENSLTEDHREFIKSQKEAKRESKALRQLKKTNPPVLPRNSANLYCQERSKMADIKELMKTRRPAQVFSEIFKEYRSLSESEKKKYLDMQEEDKERFQHEFLAWYEGIQSNENLNKAAREQAEAMRSRLKL